ncbi:MAG TPA: NADH-quinone oxidoreductase subunit NuoG [Burkholderiaceae bacterium]|nr:NADH-quinone oxidoreductase subunit NuoG [Burkholderiaceae bacterium]
MIELQIDGRKVAVREGRTVMDAANELGIYVPHFCYHRKLSIAANCRMCLVDIEKSPKPMPACATPVMPGMVVHTSNARAKQAQRSVMEFLLINHPLDCPICDQGGECQLQDLAVGYGPSTSRYREEKRVVLQKDLGPLVSAQEMNRCIHCTRCVRFGQEIAGIMELGMAGHGEHSEILPFVGRTVNSELSGNLIDVCPVGALTSKPFRYRARTWELARRRSISPHDSLGSNLVLQVKADTVVRVVPLENEAINECWLSDRDRFSYEGMDSAERLTRPLLRRDGVLQEVTWPEALAFVAQTLARVREQRGGETIGALAAGTATAEELYLLGKITRAMGSQSIDFRLRHWDFRDDERRGGVPWLGMPIAEFGALDRLLLVGSFLRQDHPLLAARIRRAVASGCRLSVVHAVDGNPLMAVAHKAIAAPSSWVSLLAQVAVAVARAKSVPPPVSGIEPGAAAAAIAQDLASGSRVALMAGNAATQHPQASQIRAWLQWIAQALNARFGEIGEAANSVGGYLAGATPGPGGRNARSMMEQPMAAYLLWGLEPGLDCADPARARAALAAADAVIAFSSYRCAELEAAHAVLPIATFAETAGTFVNCEGRAQSFNGAVRPPGEARPGWKVLRVLGNELGLTGFDYESPEQVRAEALPVNPRWPLSNRTEVPPQASDPSAAGGCERIADVPPYFSDPIVRRGEALQRTVLAHAPIVGANATTLALFGVEPGATVRVRQEGAEALLRCELDAALPDRVVHVAAGHPSTARLGPMFGSITLERT